MAALISTERTTARSRFAFLQLSDPSGSFEVTLFAEQLSRAREHLETGRPVLVDGEVRMDGDLVKVLASSVVPLDAALEVARSNGNGHAADRIAVKLADSAVASELEDLLGAVTGSSVGVRLVVPLEDSEVAIDLSDNHRLALMRRPDLGDLAPGAGDRVAHLDQFREHLARHAMLGGRLGYRALDPVERLSSSSVSAERLRLAYWARNQRPRGLAFSSASSEA